MPEVKLETPEDKTHGELSCNIALKSAKLFKKSPMDIAKQFQPVIQSCISASSLKNAISDIKVENPGFINFYLSKTSLHETLDQIFIQQGDFGRNHLGQKRKVQIEFVSANPTGPLSIAYGRQAAVGDALANIFRFLGFDPCKEYYINDEGHQIDMLGLSIKSRAVEILTGQVDFPEDGYQGEYIKDMAQLFLDHHHIGDIKKLESIDLKEFRGWGVEYLMGVIRQDLDDFGVKFDVWTSQSKVADEKAVLAGVEFLKSKGLTYEQDGALWFKTTQFGDDKDRVIRKSDGSTTYLMPDIVYHKDKFGRGFDMVIDILGPDHHGYIARLKASAQALGRNPDDLRVLIVQLATIYRHGKAISMSTRRGQYISLREVIDEVGVDAVRFFFLMRHVSAHLDFDLELAKQQTPENPVYYIQYAHARVHSMNKKAKEASIQPKQRDFSLLNEEEELDLIKKLARFSDTLGYCYEQIDPYALTAYLQELATTFHKFYDRHRVISEDQDLSAQRLGLANATRIVLANGLRLLGVSAPESM